MKPTTWDETHGFIKHETKELALAHMTKMLDTQSLTPRHTGYRTIEPFLIDKTLKILGEKVLHA